MPSGRELTVERIYEGYRKVEYETRAPLGHSVVMLEEEDHVHIVYGSEQELRELGLLDTEVNVTVTVDEDEAPKKRTRKPTAKKAT